MKTRSEKLQGYTGKTECDICHKKKQFNINTWKMTPDHLVVCPECQPKMANKVMVSI